MATRTIIGHLGGDPEIKTAGKTEIVKFRVLENTGEFRNGEWQKDHNPITHYVEAKFELGESVASSLNKGDRVIVIGDERDSSYPKGEDWVYGGRVVHATEVAPTLSKGTRKSE